MTRRSNGSVALQSLLQRTAHTLACAGLLLSPAMFAAKKAPPAKPAGEYLVHDTHENEKVTIAAEPCDREQDCDFFRLPYVRHSLLPVRVIITNDSDRAITLDEVRIQFIAANGDKLPAATDDELNRRLFTYKSTQPTKIPLIPYSIKKTPIDKKITQDDDDFGFVSTTVNAHSTAAGYLFYDVKDLDDPALRGAELYVKEIWTMDKKNQLFNFTLKFDPWLDDVEAKRKDKAAADKAAADKAKQQKQGQQQQPGSSNKPIISN